MRHGGGEYPGLSVTRDYFLRLQYIDIDDQLEISLTVKGGCFFKCFWEKPNEHFYRLWASLFKIQFQYLAASSHNSVVRLS